LPLIHSWTRSQAKKRALRDAWFSQTNLTKLQVLGAVCSILLSSNKGLCLVSSPGTSAMDSSNRATSCSSLVLEPTITDSNTRTLTHSRPSLPITILVSSLFIIHGPLDLLLSINILGNKEPNHNIGKHLLTS
jgi:hypothetical protein